MAGFLLGALLYPADLDTLLHHPKTTRQKLDDVAGHLTGRTSISVAGAHNFACAERGTSSPATAQYAPSPAMTQGSVIARIRRSRPSERFSMYSRSTARRSSKVSLPRP